MSRFVVLTTNLMDASRVQSAVPDAVVARSLADDALTGADVILLDLTAGFDPADVVALGPPAPPDRSRTRPGQNDAEMSDGGKGRGPRREGNGKRNRAPHNESRIRPRLKDAETSGRGEAGLLLTGFVGWCLFWFSWCSVGGQWAFGGLCDEVVGGEGEGDCLVVVFVGVVVHSVDAGGAFLESDVGEFVE